MKKMEGSYYKKIRIEFNLEKDWDVEKINWEYVGGFWRKNLKGILSKSHFYRIFEYEFSLGKESFIPLKKEGRLFLCSFPHLKKWCEEMKKHYPFWEKSPLPFSQLELPLKIEEKKDEENNLEEKINDLYSKINTINFHIDIILDLLNKEIKK